jgi:signal transduction histidine kinase
VSDRAVVLQRAPDDRATWFRRLEALTDRFIPPAILSRSTEDARRARLGVAFAWIGTCAFLLAVFVQGPVNSRALLVLNALSALLCFSAPFVLRRIGRPALIGHGVLALSFCKYVAVAIVLRGAGLTGAAVVLSQLPLFATFFLGVRAGTVWAMLTIAAGAAIGLLGRAGIIVDHLPPQNRLFNDHFVLAASTAVLFTVAALYERKKNEAQRDLSDLEARRRIAELERGQAVSKAQAAETERLASLGRIAAATAHEINNPLTYVLGNLHLLAESLPADRAAEIEPLIQDAVAGAERIGRIVADMRLFVQPRDGALSAVRVDDAVELALTMAQAQTRARAQVHKRLDAALPPVMADVSRLAEVLVHFLVNAAQAIPEGQAAAHEIVVEAREAEAAAKVIVEVRGTGRAISAELDDETSAPSFASTSLGEGAVLGLALCESIVQSFGGTMALESRAGRTVARLTLVAATTVESKAKAEGRRS